MHKCASEYFFFTYTFDIMLLLLGLSVLYLMKCLIYKTVIYIQQKCSLNML